MANKHSFVYMMTNRTNRVLYTGVTSDLKKRVWQHREKSVAGFTSRYNLDKLVYYEVFRSMSSAINREKQIKAGSRSTKNELVSKKNPEWLDLYEAL